MFIQNLIVEMKSEMSFLKKNQASSIKDPTHIIQCNPLIVLYFKKQNLTR